ncbi:MAG: malonyl CoA-acyl carrier protein transacylase [Alphaproteobacteria bacterium]|nr:MAG: malonyl CoA-acyl carrier protein transacylase [Alphaproteobacteria bacterium]
MAEGPAEDLQLTQNAQPALFTSSICTLRVLQNQTGKTISELCSYVAGHSLGEYSALCATGSLGIAETARLLHLRGQSMQEAVPVGEGAMAALIGADLALAEEIAFAAADAGLVEIANDNADGQIVLSGASAGVNKAMAVAKDKGLRRVVKLPVSAPFHCQMMAPAADVMSQALADTDFKNANVPVVQNVTVQPETSADVLRENLVSQVTGRVRWRETMNFFNQSEVTSFVELGTGKVLSGLAKRAAPDANIHTLDTLDDILAYLR